MHKNASKISKHIKKPTLSDGDFNIDEFWENDILVKINIQNSKNFNQCSLYNIAWHKSHDMALLIEIDKLEKPIHGICSIEIITDEPTRFQLMKMKECFWQKMLDHTLDSIIEQELGDVI